MAPPDPALPAPTDLSRSVAADMEAIFAEAPVQAASVTETPVQVLRRSGPGQGRLRPTVVGLVLAAGVAGIAAGAFIPRGPPAPPPVMTTPAAAVISAPAVTAAVAPAPITATAETAAPAPRILPAARSVPRRMTARPRPVPVVRRRPEPDAVMAADRRLRQAYDRAVRAGVARPILVDYRDRWADLREREAGRPDRLAVAYRELSDSLGRMTDRPRDHRAEPMDELRLRSPLPWR